MGTQQILLIVLSVIIVGIAVAVGITMFQQNAANQNRQAVIADMNTFASSAMAYYKTPTSHGGAGSPTNWSTVTLDDVGTWIGYNYASASDSCYTDNGGYKLSISGNNLQIIGYGSETGNDGSAVVKATVTIEPDGDVTTAINN